MGRRRTLVDNTRLIITNNRCVVGTVNSYSNRSQAKRKRVETGVIQKNLSPSLTLRQPNETEEKQKQKQKKKKF